MKQAIAFAPANISCIFKIHKGDSFETTGSTGVGFTLNKGVTASITKSDVNKVFFNQQEIYIAPVTSLSKKLATIPLHISLESEFPLGGGFGISGAATLATAYAINDLIDLKYEKLELAKLSHIAEVENGTGLGDIVNQYFGGFLLKVKPSFLFEAINLQIADTSVFCKHISSVETKSVIQNAERQKTINIAAEKAMKKIEEMIAKDTISFERVIAISKEFAIESGLLQNKEIIEIIRQIEAKGGKASMIMIGNGVFSNIPFEGSKKYTIL